MSSIKSLPLDQFLATLAAKQPTPGGGAAAAVGAAIGNAAASMAAAYTTRKKDAESGAKEKAMVLQSAMDVTEFLQAADDDAEAYADLQRTWKESVPEDEKAKIEARALAIPTNLVETCHKNILSIHGFLPHCNTNITSDAKVGIHTLAGAARAAYQTVLVNSPTEEEKMRLQALLKEIRDVEDELL
ncbi:formiminotransferase-cyclodeaminase [Skeletonema marinoi]|uniref:Formiminotransferase-cyclodeaminase n=1 Tax=Skeletonema marinoi TaxID=267567 RepID=A0AAD8Y8L1_9STRA|nr:formiminotransferase-cyclodeaminase [Skeletonema marinoi]